MRRIVNLLLFIPLMLSSACSKGSDLVREARLAEQIEYAIFDGEPVYLETPDGHRFLSVYTETDEARGAVIVMHGRGYHPDWADTTNPLRVGLAENGWDTLSIQMPVLDKQAKYFDYVPVFAESFPRIETAIQTLRDKGHERIFLAAHSCSVHMVNAWVLEGRLDGVAGYIGIGMGATDFRQLMVHEWRLANMAMPILDIYGSEDYPAVHRMAPERLAAIEQSDERSRQIVIEGANHDFLDKGDELVEAVSAWLDAL